jgi:hypothetical protein
LGVFRGKRGVRRATAANALPHPARACACAGARGCADRGRSLCDSPVPQLPPGHDHTGEAMRAVRVLRLQLVVSVRVCCAHS